MTHPVIKIPSGWTRLWSRVRLPVTKLDLEQMETRIMSKVSELAGIITGIKEQVTKSKTEILNRIAALEASLANQELPAEATAALEALKSEVQSVDDINPDAPAQTT